MTPQTESCIACYFDGACAGNQFARRGPMKAAFVVGNQEFIRDVPDLQSSTGPTRSNNIAEYFGLIFLLRHLRELDLKTRDRVPYRVHGDSELVIRQMRGEYRVKAPHLRPLHDEARRLAADLDVEFRSVPRERNPAGSLLE